MQKLLFLAHRIPYPPDKGDKIRSWHILRHFMQTHRVHVGCFIDDPADRIHVPGLRAQCAELACFERRPRWQRLRSLAHVRPGLPLSIAYFHDPRLHRWVRETVRRERIERVFVFSSAMAPYAMDLPSELTAERRLLDLVDVDSSKWTEYAERAAWPMREVWAREGRTLLAFERRACGFFDHSLFVSEQERAHFQRLAPECAERTGALSNGVDFDHFSPEHPFADPMPASGPRLVFTGAMDYRPNIDAVAWFAREALPSLAARRGGVSFWVVGANPSAEVRALAALPGVHVTGRVPDTRPYLAHADVVVAPLRIARGVQNKVLEAMAMARPVVATPQAFEGLRAEPGRELLVAGTAEAMAGYVAEVLDGMHPTLGRDARRAVQTRYAWSTTLAALDRLWQAEPGQAPSEPMRQQQPEVPA